jgi:hypothetical protein
MKQFLLMTALFLCTQLRAGAQEFFNLTADEVRIDSVLPVFTHQIALGRHYADSVYEVSIDYPEFIDMSATDIRRYQLITSDTLPPLPQVRQYVAVSRKEGMLCLSFVPLVLRDGHYQKLVSFKLSVNAKPVAKSRAQKAEASASERYAAHSVLATGRWVKISVPETGFYHLSDELISQAGFSNPAKVRVYGYGGALQPEKLTGDYLTETDDLKEVPTCYVGGRRLFYAVGPVNWDSPTSQQRTRNNYSTHGYYFLTEREADPLTADQQAFAASFYPGANDYHSIAEPEEYAWFHGGRNLFAKTPLSFTSDASYTLVSGSQEATLSVAMTYNGYCEATVAVNGQTVGSIVVSEATVRKGVSYFNESTTYSTVATYTWNFSLSSLNVGENVITLRQTAGSGTSMRTDHVTLTFKQPKAMPDLATADFPVPQYEYEITNQDHHADTAVDMLIIVPTSRKLMEQAERLKTLHEQEDSMRVRIISADELYNEFSSGTPDANAYRRYLKMLYDRAATDADMPSYLLLMGDCAWDNRMLISEFSQMSPDDFLLCYESEDSFSETFCYVSDDYFCLLDDGEEMEDSSTPTSADRYRGKPDVAVGRISARTANEAKTVADKTIGYYANEEAGAWQNTLCFMADDGNNNLHMNDAESVIKTVKQNSTAYNIKKVYWDAYTRVTSATGNSYPDVTRLIKEQMRDGALIMNYSGHGAAYCLSHEQVLVLADFAAATSMRLPLWVTASCDIMPFDGQDENIGETAMFNSKGGAVVFFGTTRTVFTNRNLNINRSFMKHVLSMKNGKRVSVGEAVRLAKNEMVEARLDQTANKLQYTLLGDPALVLAAPTLTATVDSINGQPTAPNASTANAAAASTASAASDSSASSDNSTTLTLSAGSLVTLKGHIEGQPDFNGVATIVVRDCEETIVCKKNNADTQTAMTYQDRPSTIYMGTDSVRQGQYSFTFAVPHDISYSDATGLILVYAVSNSKKMEAHGEQGGFIMNGTAETVNDGIGPTIYCNLNSSAFSNGDVVNSTPFFYAELTDKDGINAAGSGIGHDMELIIDGDLSRTYILNSYFQYSFGDYRNGSVSYSIPALDEGPHKLLFRAWDVLNNSSTAELTFTVDPTLEPQLTKVVCLTNPARSGTRFLIRHDRAGSDMDVTLDIFDMSGRLLWSRSENCVPTDHTYVVDWDLTVNGGRLKTGVYLYRVRVSSNGSSEASAAQKLIVL